MTNSALSWVGKIPWWVAVAGSLTLGLAPYSPQPHLIEKLQMLFSGTLVRPIDVFDLVMHGAFPLLLLLKIAASRSRERK